MANPRRGDLRAFALRGTVHYALIHSWGGNPDSLALMVSTDHRIYFRFADSTIDPIETGLLMTEERDTARDELLAWLDTKAGKTLVRDARGASTASIDVHGQIRQREQPIAASEGAGFPHYADPPAKLHSNEFPAWLSARFERYLFLRPQYEATLQRLAERHPAHYQVYIEHVHGGRRLTEIAQQLGITAGNARYRQHQARRFVREGLADED